MPNVFEKNFFLSSDGETQISYSVMKPEMQPVAVLQICHGMAEHIDRYADFAAFMAEQGVVVCGCDHKGHGASIGENGAAGYFGEGKALDVLVEDQLLLYNLMRKTYRHLPYILLGHSMGSFVARKFIVKHTDTVDGAIICGTAGPGTPAGPGIALAKIIGLFTKKKKPCPLLGKVAFAGYNKKTGSKNPSSWLTKDSEIVDRYNADPLCGFAFTPSAYRQMFECIKEVNADEWFESVPLSLPILVTAGEEDPVGNYGDGPNKVYDRLNERELSDLWLKMYKGDRHEILNETDRETVYADFFSFVSSVVEGVRAARTGQTY